MTLAFARWIVAPGISTNGPSYLMQKPIFRLVAQGPAWVALFIILSGFVNGLRPIKLARSGQVDGALSNLATSSFRRSFRLFLPAVTATTASWFVCQFGAYETARNSDAFWLAITSPKKSQSWGIAIDDLVRAVRDTWLFDPNNPYDQPQWALIYLMLGSMICFMALLMFLNLTPMFRVIAVTGVWCWGWNWDIKIGAREYCFHTKSLLADFVAYVAVGIFTGLLLAELHLSEIPLRCSRFSPIFAPPLTVISLVLMSFPAEYQKEQTWCRFLLNLHYKIFPTYAFVDRTWPTMGSSLLCFTIIMSPHLRKILSKRPLLWLGKISFPLYLLHGSFMRSILSWLLFAKQSLVEFEEQNGSETYVIMKYPLPGASTFCIVLPIFFAVLFLATQFWATKIEPHFGAVTKLLEDIMFGKREINKPTILPTRHE